MADVASSSLAPLLELSLEEGQASRQTLEFFEIGIAWRLSAAVEGGREFTLSEHLPRAQGWGRRGAEHVLESQARVALIPGADDFGRVTASLRLSVLICQETRHKASCAVTCTRRHSARCRACGW